MADDAAEQAYAAAARQIESIRRSGTKSLSFEELKFSELERFPDNIIEISNLEHVFAGGTKIKCLGILSEVKNLGLLTIDQAKINDLTPLIHCKQLSVLDIRNTFIYDISTIVSLENIKILKIDKTNVLDLRPIKFMFSFKKSERGAMISFKNTPATARDGRLAELSEIEDDHERTSKTLEYLRSLPPWPEPYTPEYTPDGSPPQPIGGEAEAEADEVLVPAPVRAPLEVEVVDGRLRPARPGDGLGADAHEHARQAWQALRDFLADLVDIRPRIVNQMPQLERALTRLEDALGADYEAANPIAMGINGNRVIAQAGAAGETMADADAAELREFAAALSLFLERFPAWRTYRDETAPAPPAAPRIEEAIPEIEAITEELREHEAIDPSIPESLEKQAGDVRSNPEDSLAKRGLVDSLNNFLGRIGEAILAGGKWVPGEAKDIAGKTWKMIKVGAAYKVARWALDTEDGLFAVARGLFQSRVADLKKLAEEHPTEFGWLKSFLKLLLL